MNPSLRPFMVTSMVESSGAVRIFSQTWAIGIVEPGWPLPEISDLHNRVVITSQNETSSRRGQWRVIVWLTRGWKIQEHSLTKPVRADIFIGCLESGQGDSMLAGNAAKGFALFYCVGFGGWCQWLR